MTQDDIKGKLFDVLNRIPADASDVVYAFVKIRKLLEGSDQKQRYALVNLFCNWLMHVELSNPTVAAILGTLDHEFRQFDPKRPFDFDPKGIVLDTLSLQFFRNELTDVLTVNDLPTVWMEDPAAWVEFLRLYGEEVRDTPLVLANDKYPFVFIARVVITACEPAQPIVDANPEQEFTGLKWEFTLKDGRTFTRSFTINIPQLPPNWPTMGTKVRG